MNQNHPPKVRAMLDRLKLIKTDLSGVGMSVSLDGNIQNLPDTAEILSSVNTEDKQRLLKALSDAFEKRDLTRVSALYSYICMFSESDQRDIKAKTIEDFQLYLRGHKNENELNEIFMHLGFSILINGLNYQELTDLQFRLFSRYHLENKTTIGKRIARIQKNLPLSKEQADEVVQYLEEMKAEKQQNDVAEKKKSNTALIFGLIGIALVIIRILLRLARD